MKGDPWSIMQNLFFPQSNLVIPAQIFTMEHLRLLVSCVLCNLFYFKTSSFFKRMQDEAFSNADSLANNVRA